MTTPSRTLYRFSVRMNGRWEARPRVQKDRPTKAEAQRLASNINGIRSRDEPEPCDAVKIVRVEEFDEEVIEL